MEIRYREGKVDLGVFAPEELLSIEDAEGLVVEFAKGWGQLF